MVQLESSGLRVARWITAVVLVAIAHGAAVAWALRSPPSDEWESQTGGAFVVELSAITASPDETNNDVAVGERSEELAAVAASAPQVAAAAEAQPDEQPIVPEAADPPPEDAVAKRLDEKPPEDLKPPEVSAARTEDAPTVAPVQASEAAAPQNIENATETSDKARGQNEGVSRIDRIAIVNWQRDLVAHMNRHKRYPEKARNARQSGIVSIAFTIDRAGGLLRAAVVKGSGIETLDRAAVDMLKRASPLPPPPDSVHGESIEFVVPVRFRWKS